jgi:hypothetical protein
MAVVLTAAANLQTTNACCKELIKADQKLHIQKTEFRTSGMDHRASDRQNN